MMTTIARLCLILGLASVACSPVLAKGAAGAGTYAADLPSASGCGRRLLLELFTDGSYVFVQRYLCRPWSPAQMKTGSWKIEGARMVLSSDEEKMRFSMDAGALDYIGTRYGQMGLRLDRLKLPGS
jgi:hypothetical protein